MKVHVAFVPDEAASAPVGIVIDVLRATSTIAQALAAGYARVLCVVPRFARMIGSAAEVVA